MTRTRDGDLDAYEVLVARYTAVAHRTAVLLGAGDDAAERRAALLDALRALDERDREVVACRYLLDLSEAETAQALGWPKGTVKSRTARALARLRTRLGAREEVRDGR